MERGPGRFHHQFDTSRTYTWLDSCEPATVVIDRIDYRGNEIETKIALMFSSYSLTFLTYGTSFCSESTKSYQGCMHLQSSLHNAIHQGELSIIVLPSLKTSGLY